MNREATRDKSSSRRFHLDSGATSHLTNQATLSDKQINSHAQLSQVQPRGAVQCANGAKQAVVGAVDIGRVKGAKVVKGLSTNLVSVGKLCDSGQAILFTSDGTYSIPTKQVNTSSSYMTKIGSRQSDGLYDCNREWMLNNEDKAYLELTQPEDLETKNATTSSISNPEQTQASSHQGGRGILTLRGGLATRVTRGRLRSANSGSRLRHRSHHVSNVKTTPRDNLTLWHQRLGHLAPASIIRAVKQGIITGPTSLLSLKDMTIKKLADAPLCETCAVANFQRHAKPLKSHDKERATHPFHTLALDTAGPISPVSRRRERWFLCITDHHTNAIWAYPMINRNDAADKFKQFCEDVVGADKLHLINTIRMDGAREQKFGPLKKYLQQIGVTNLEVTAPDASHQNGKAERAIRSLTRLTRSLITHGRAPRGVWDYALKHAALLLRHLPSRTNPECKAPCQLLNGDSTPVKLHKLRTFYAPVVYRDRDTAISKSRRFFNRGRKGYFLGYSNSQMTSYWIRTRTGKIHNLGSRDVDFYEDLQHAQNLRPSLPKPSLFENESSIATTGSAAAHHSEEENYEQAEDDSDHSASSQEEYTASSQEENSTKDHSNQESPKRYSKRQRKPTAIHNAGGSQEDLINFHNQRKHGLAGLTTDFAGYTCSTSTKVQKITEAFTPRTYQEAITCMDSKLWVQPMNEEFENMIRNQVWEIIDRPPNIKTIKAKWVFKCKPDEQGDVERRRARITALGCSQIKGYNYSYTFSPTLGHTTLRLVFWIITEYGMYAWQFDIKSAFLAATLKADNTIYMLPPPGLEAYLKRSLAGKVLLLKKSLYGLKQAPREFNKMLNRALVQIGFRPMISDPCLFSRRNDKGWTIIAIWVDDGIVASTAESEVHETIKEIKKVFTLGQAEPLNFFLGLKITHKREQRLLAVSSERYINELVERFRGSDFKTKKRKTPQEPGSKLMKPTGDVKERLSYQTTRSYRELVGSLLYISITTRPDIAFAVGRLARYMSDFDDTHWQAAIYLLGYLNTHKDKELMFKGSNKKGNTKKSHQITCYTDASWADDPDTRRSTAGYLVYIDDTLLFWGSKLERLHALSTAEAEYLAAIRGLKEVLHLQNLLKELKIHEQDAPVIYIDNAACVNILEGDDNNRSKTRHMDLRVKWMRYYITSGRVRVRWIDGAKQPADVLTKAVTSTVFARHIDTLCVTSGPLI